MHNRKRILSMVIVGTLLSSNLVVPLLSSNSIEYNELSNKKLIGSTTNTKDVVKNDKTKNMVSAKVDKTNTEEADNVKTNEIKADEGEFTSNGSIGEEQKYLENIQLTYRGDEKEAPSIHVVNSPSVNNPGNDLVSSLPSSYTTQDLPEIRNQNPYGTCWTFSSSALAEIGIKKRENKAIDLSESHLAYFTYQGVNDPLGLISNDSNGIGEGYGPFYELGGNLCYSVETYACWKGAADEGSYPYGAIATLNSSNMTDEDAFNDVAHLRSAYFVNSSDMEDVKAMIMEYGAVGLSYYEDKSLKSFSSANNCYYQTSKVGSTNHAITVVGWDDNFSASKFVSTPPGNGAWLVRNSWGGVGYNHYGYFWISYYDKSISDTAYVFDFVSDESDEFYDNNYQYDGAAGTGGFGSAINKYDASFANVFTVQHDIEELKAVSFESSNVNMTYQVKIYKDLINVNSPDSGTLVAAKPGNTTYAGIYNVKLDEGIKLEKGTVYAVVIEINKNENGIGVACESSIEGWFVSEAGSNPGESFMRLNDYSWNDFSKENKRNFRIKAFTNDIKIPCEHVDEDNNGICEKCDKRFKYQVSFSAKVDGVVSSETVATLSGNGFYRDDEEVTVVAPKKTGYKFAGWYLSDDEEHALSSKLSYKFVMTGEDIQLVAKYVANNIVALKVSGISGKYSVNGVNQVAGTYNNTVTAGTSVTVSYTGDGEFCYWKDATGRIVSKNSSYEFTVVSNTAIEAVSVENKGSEISDYSALVEFVSYYGQIVDSEMWNSSDNPETKVLPNAPSKFGETFLYWSIDGKNAVTVSDIIAKIDSSVARITVKPVYKKTTEKYSVTVRYQSELGISNDVYSNNVLGSGLVVSPKVVEGKVFAYWASDIEGNNILSFNEDYFLRVSGNLIIYAIYADEKVDVVPIITFTNVFKGIVNGRDKIALEITRSVSESYEVLETGVVGIVNGTYTGESDMTVESDVATKVVSSSTSNNGVYTINLDVTGKYDTVMAIRGYMILKNNDNGNIETIYTEVKTITYN